MRHGIGVLTLAAALLGTSQMLVAETTYTYDNGNWSPSEPSSTLQDDTILEVVKGTATFDTLSGLFNLTKTGIGTLELNGNNFSAENPFTGGVSVLGGTFTLGQWSSINPNANILVGGGTLSSAANLVFGFNGAGTLDVNGGGIVEGNRIYIADQVGSEAEVTVSGNGSKITSTGNLVIGNNGTAKLDISGGGVVETVEGNLVIGYEDTGTGVVTIDGAGSQLNSGRHIYVGYNGSGKIDITNGGTLQTTNVQKVTSYSISLGYAKTGVGTVTVSGNGSKLESELNIYVGNAGTGYLTVSDWGQLITRRGTADGQTTLGWIRIGQQEGSFGSVTVDGSGSKMESADDLIVGMAGTGMLNITGGATAKSNSALIIGQEATGVGTVNVKGSGSSLTYAPYDSGEFRIGNAGTGRLNIADGAKVTTAGRGHSVNIGELAGSTGTVNVDNATLDGGLYLGARGNGTMNLLNGSTLTTGLLRIGFNKNSHGKLTVAGASVIDFCYSNNVLIGSVGTGILEIVEGSSMNLTGSSDDVNPSSAVRGVKCCNLQGQGAKIFTTSDSKLFFELPRNLQSQSL